MDEGKPSTIESNNYRRGGGVPAFPGTTQVNYYALIPVNGKLPIGPMPISPDMLSPDTLPVKASVSCIGLVMEIFQATSSPDTVPSKISPVLPSAPCVPPEPFSESVALRSPIGVVITIFQFPSTAISALLKFLRKTGMVLG